MKRTILMILAVSFIAVNLSAQSNRTSIRIGAKAGINFSNVYDEAGNEFEADGKFGFVAGGFLAIPLGKYLGVQPEILFSQKGYQGTTYIGGMGFEYKRTSNFIDVPLFITLKPSNKLSLMAGPQYSYLIKQKDKFDNITEEQNFTNNNLRRNILCFIGGFDINMTNLILGARVGWDLQNNNGDGTSSIPRYKNVWYQVTLGFSF